MALGETAAPFKRGLAFLAGLGFSAVPAIGPFFAVIAVTATRFEIHRADRWWWGCALLLGLPWIVGGHLLAGVLATAQVLSVWLIFRSATTIRIALNKTDLPREAGTGLVLGLAVTLVLGLAQMSGFAWETAFTPLDAITWTGPSALFGHAVLVLSSLLAIVVASPRLRALALALGAAGVVFSGAREAIVAWLFVALVLQLLHRSGDRVVRLGEWLLIAVMAIIVSGVGTYFGLGRAGFVTDLVPDTRGPNLLRGTEVAAGDWWHTLGVSVRASPVAIGGDDRLGLVLTKTWREPWSRLQQAVTLHPGEVYTLSGVWRAAEGIEPGLDGWGRAGEASAPSALSATQRGGALVAEASGDVTVLATSLTALPEGWVRGVVTFAYTGQRPLAWYTGATVDRSFRTGVSATFAELQLTSTAEPVAYVPGVAARGVVDLRASRLPVWNDARAAVAARPLLGWGPDGLPRAVESLRPSDARVRPTPVHAHNMLLAVWVDRGLLGVVGLLGLVALLALRAIQRRDRVVVAVLLAIAAVNVFDATLLSGVVIYPLAAVLGWRAVGREVAAQHETGLGSALFARWSLASGDLAVAWLSLTAAVALVGPGDGSAPFATLLSAPVLYASLAWPLAAWWTGQYPGYGRPPADELRRSVLSATFAGLTLVLVKTAFGDAFPLPLAVVAVAALLPIVLAPPTRAFIKRALSTMGVWGRPVLLVGHGGSADGIALELLDQPLLGLHPLALVDGAPPVDRHARLRPLARSTLPPASAAVASQVIVVPGRQRSRVVDDALVTGRRSAYRHVQLVPALGTLPASGVVAHQIGRTLLLEARNNLASGTNRALKRAFDLLAVGVGGIVVLPLLLIIALAIKIDSPGPVLFGHTRIGRDGRAITVWKFRSMVIDAPHRLEALLATNAAARDEWNATQKLTDDPRVTALGRLLRASSLDELPQLWNVLTGTMSLVGPRPIVSEEVARYGDDFEIYMQVRPGITGYWQVSGRSDTTYAQRVEMETFYVRNWSLWLDLVILAQTIEAVWRRRGAY
jgi:Undecaprenyl-phosphate galactose phosphotransferase WbaP